MAERKVLCLRHGEYDGAYSLTERGRAQVQATTEKIGILMAEADYPVVKIYSSPWQRTLESAQIIASSINIKPIKALDCLAKMPLGQDFEQVLNEILEGELNLLIIVTHLPVVEVSLKILGERLNLVWKGFENPTFAQGWLADLKTKTFRPFP